MPTQAPEIFVNKLAAARRLLCAAIRLHCSNEDALAVHVIASSGYSILSEMKRSRGGNEAHLVAETEMLGFVKMAQDLTSGQLSAKVAADLAEDDYTRELLERLASKLNLTGSTDLTSLGMTIEVSPQYSQSFHRKRTQAFNYLKHANDDSEPLLKESTIDNFSLLMNAMFSY